MTEYDAWSLNLETTFSSSTSNLRALKELGEELGVRERLRLVIHLQHLPYNTSCLRSQTYSFTLQSYDPLPAESKLDNYILSGLALFKKAKSVQAQLRLNLKWFQMFATTSRVIFICLTQRTGVMRPGQVLRFT